MNNIFRLLAGLLSLGCFYMIYFLIRILNFDFVLPVFSGLVGFLFAAYAITGKSHVGSIYGRANYDQNISMKDLVKFGIVALAIGLITFAYIALKH